MRTVRAGPLAETASCSNGALNGIVALAVQTDAEQRAEPLLGVQQIRQPDLGVHLLNFPW